MLGQLGIGSCIGFNCSHRHGHCRMPSAVSPLSSREIELRGLPREHDGVVLVYISDLHLGSLLGERWLTAIVDRVNAQDPSIITLGSDVFDGSSRHSEALVPALKRLHAPLGVWAVT
ncbi:MAG: hypothetical protein HYX75_17370 [Acidobacteria bacterium]|nr:hypothetical protein [Acidobacteriota bacterium]